MYRVRIDLFAGCAVRKRKGQESSATEVEETLDGSMAIVAGPS